MVISDDVLLSEIVQYMTLAWGLVYFLQMDTIWNLLDVWWISWIVEQCVFLDNHWKSYLPWKPFQVLYFQQDAIAFPVLGYLPSRVQEYNARHCRKICTQRDIEWLPRIHTITLRDPYTLPPIRVLQGQAFGRSEMLPLMDISKHVPPLNFGPLPYYVQVRQRK